MRNEPQSCGSGKKYQITPSPTYFNTLCDAQFAFPKKINKRTIFQLHGLCFDDFLFEKLYAKSVSFVHFVVREIF